MSTSLLPHDANLERGWVGGWVGNHCCVWSYTLVVEYWPLAVHVSAWGLAQRTKALTTASTILPFLLSISLQCNFGRDNPVVYCFHGFKHKTRRC